MRLFVLLSRVPYPLEKGDKLRAYHLIKRLARDHEIYLFCLSDQKVEQENIDHLKGFCAHLEIYTIPTWRIFSSLIRAAFRKMPFQVAYFYHRSAHRRINQAIASFKPEHVLCQLVRTSEYIRERFDLNRTLDFMDTLSKGMDCLLYTSPSPRDKRQSRMPSSA